MVALHLARLGVYHAGARRESAGTRERTLDPCYVSWCMVAQVEVEVGVSGGPVTLGTYVLVCEAAGGIEGHIAVTVCYFLVAMQGLMYYAFMYASDILIDCYFVGSLYVLGEFGRAS